MSNKIPARIKTISLPAPEEGETSYKIIIGEDGSLRIIPVEKPWLDTLELAPEQVTTLMEELTQWALSQMDQRAMGERVRAIWVAEKESDLEQELYVPPHHLLPYHKLDERNQRIDDFIGIGVARHAFNFLVKLFQPR